MLYGIERLGGRMVDERVAHGYEELEQRQPQQLGQGAVGVEIKSLDALRVHHRENHRLAVRRFGHQSPASAVQGRYVLVLQRTGVLPEQLSVQRSALEAIDNLYELE